MEQDFFHQVITGGQVIIQRDPLRNQVGTDIILFRSAEGIHTNGASHQIAPHEDGKLFLAVSISIQLAHQTGEQTQVMDVFLGKGTGVKVQICFANAVHTGYSGHAADAVRTGFIGDLILTDFLGQVSNGNRGKGGDHFAVVIFLFFGMGGINDCLLFFFRHTGLDLRQPVGKGSVQFFLQAGFGIGGGQCIQLGIHIPVGDGGGEQAFGVLIHDIGLVFCGFGIIEGVAGDRIVIRKVRHDSIDRIAVFQRQFAVQQLGGHDGIQLNRIKAVLRDLFQGVIDHGTESFGIFCIDIGCLKDKGVIGGCKLAAAGEGTGGESFLQVLHEQGSFVAQKLPNVVHSTLLRFIVLQTGADDIVVDHGLIDRIGTLSDSVGNTGDNGLSDPGIAAVREGKFLLLIGTEGFVQQLQERSVILKGTVQEADAVGRMIKGVVVVFQSIPGHVRDGFGLSAVVVSQGSTGESDQVGIVHGAALQRHGAGHFTVNGAVQRQGAVHVLHFITPGFRAVDVLTFLDDRMQAAVCIKIRQGKQLLLRKGRDRIAGHGVRGIGVHISLVRLINQIEPQGGTGIFRRSGQGAVLKHMGQAGVIDRPGGEGQLEGTVGILIGDVEEFCTGLQVLKKHQIRADHLKRTDLFDFKAFNHIPDRGEGDSFSGFSRGRLCHGWQYTGQQGKGKEQG